MRYQTSHLLSLLAKLLKTKTFNYLNRGNPLDKCKLYSRTNNVKVYSKRRSCEEPTLILDQEVFVSGLVNESGDLFLSILRKRLERESNFSKLSLMTMMESGVLIYGIPNLVLGIIIFCQGSCKTELFDAEAQ